MKMEKNVETLIKAEGKVKRATSYKKANELNGDTWLKYSISV